MPIYKVLAGCVWYTPFLVEAKDEIEAKEKVLNYTEDVIECDDFICGDATDTFDWEVENGPEIDEMYKELMEEEK